MVLQNICNLSNNKYCILWISCGSEYSILRRSSNRAFCVVFRCLARFRSMCMSVLFVLTVPTYILFSSSLHPPPSSILLRRLQQRWSFYRILGSAKAHSQLGNCFSRKKVPNQNCYPSAPNLFFSLGKTYPVPSFSLSLCVICHFDGFPVPLCSGTVFTQA